MCFCSGLLGLNFGRVSKQDLWIVVFIPLNDIPVDFIDKKSFQSHYGPGVDSASNRNEYQERFLGVKAAGA